MKKLFMIRTRYTLFGVELRRPLQHGPPKYNIVLTVDEDNAAVLLARFEMMAYLETMHETYTSMGWKL